MGAFVEPALQRGAVDECGVVRQDQLAGQLVVVREQVDRHEAQLRIDEERQANGLHVEVVAQRQRGGHLGEGPVHLLAQLPQRGVRLRQLFLDAQHPPIRVGIVLLGTRFILFITAI